MTQVPAAHRLSQPVTASQNLTRNGAQKRAKGAGGQPATVTAPARADAILKAFNTWAYKREQPSCMDRLRDVATRSVLKGAPVPFVLYWGKGPRAHVASPDLACLDYLASMAARIRAAYDGGASIRLILTDTHARLNGHSEEVIASYFGEVTEAAAARSFEVVRLSALVAAAAAVAAPEDDAAPAGAILDSLTACAAKWYRGDDSTEGGAIEYYRMNMVEKRAVECAYPHAVFTTFNGAEFRELFPATMPIFYMYSLRRGFGVKPWFMPADEAVPNPTLASLPTVDPVQA